MRHRRRIGEVEHYFAADSPASEPFVSGHHRVQPRALRLAHHFLVRRIGHSHFVVRVRNHRRQNLRLHLLLDLVWFLRSLRRGGLGRILTLVDAADANAGANRSNRVRRYNVASRHHHRTLKLLQQVPLLGNFRHATAQFHPLLFLKRINKIKIRTSGGLIGGKKWERD